MLPGRDDIAMPPFTPGTSWIGGEPPAGERLTAGGPVLVHFFEVGELSGVRTLPYIGGLRTHYRKSGLRVFGVHSPRSALASSDEALEAAVTRLDLPFPVANDSEHRIWHDYGCKGWPSTFLWGRGGNLRWVHFGEGAYHETEAAVRAELGTNGKLPAPMLEPAPKRRGRRGTRLEKPSVEVFPGGAHDKPWAPSTPDEPLAVEYAGAGAWAALDGAGEIKVRIDEEESTTIALDGPGLYELSSHPHHGIHEVELWFDGEIRVWSVAFAPGPS